MKSIVQALAVFAVIACLLLPSLAAAEEKVYIYPCVITPEDRLTDGPQGELIAILGDTMLLWADLYPDMRFVHPTLYVLICREGTRIVRGEWWPVLNGDRILYSVAANHTILCPFIVGKRIETESILAYIYPLSLTRSDRLRDGPEGDPIRIVGDTMLLWVDLLPGARFAHRTLYVLVCGKESRIVRGMWWPVLNGRRLFYGVPCNYTILSPFTKQSGVRSRNVELAPSAAQRAEKDSAE